MQSNGQYSRVFFFVWGRVVFVFNDNNFSTMDVGGVGGGVAGVRIKDKDYRKSILKC